MRVAGLIFDDSRHYLDHLGPFCALLGFPLICSEPEIADLASRFYPDVEVCLIPAATLRLPRTTIACDTRPLLQAWFPDQSTNLLWLPHGNSDKGPFFESLKGETALVYGERMIDFMGEQKVYPNTIRVGNFRWEYARQKVSPPEEKTFLYAPTWDESNTLWQALPRLADQLPSDCRLWVKLHPNTRRQFAPEVERMIGRYSKGNLQFLPDDPPIYPLLAQASAYIGDMSSMGYDFLTLNRPMYFLGAVPHLPLHRCGVAIDPAQFDFALKNPCAEEQKRLYAYTFHAEAQWKEKIDAFCSL